MDKIFGDIGDLIIFDTNGIHSNFKTTTIPRTVADITFLKILNIFEDK